MKKTAVVFWSGTGNTETMANAVLAGARETGAEADLYQVSDFSAEKLAEYEAVAFGCPALGDEELETDEFEPVFQYCLPGLGGKAVALYGSYGWGDGGWMRAWEKTCADAGVKLACESVLCNETPDDEGEERCRALGKALAE